MRRHSMPILAAIASAAALGAIAACDSGDPVPGIGVRELAPPEAAAAVERSEAIRRGGVMEVGGAFLGRNPTVDFDQFAPDLGVPFPADLEEPDAVNMRGTRHTTLDDVANILRGASGLNAVFRTRYRIGGENLHVPVEGPISLDHNGPISDLVHDLAARLDLSWRFDGKTIRFDSMDTRSYDVPLPPSNGALSSTLSGVNAAENSVSTTKNIAFDPWKELEETLKTVVSSPGRVTIAPNAGRVTIFAPASEQEEAAKIVKHFELVYSQRIGLEIATFHVDVEKSSDLAADIGVSVESGDLTASLGQGLADAMRGGVGVISGREASVSLNLRALSGKRGLADYRMSNTVAQNGVIAPVVLTETRRYVSGLTRGDGENGPTVRTDNINSGISIYALPRLMLNGKIHLSVWLTQAELNNLTTFDTGEGFVQLPEVDQRAVEYTLIMDPGETLVMGGYEQERSSSSRRGGIGGLGALGFRGNRETGIRRTRLVLMVRPFIIGS